MSPTASASSLFPPAIRTAKLLGTVGAAYAAGAYLTNSRHIHSAPESITISRDLSLTLYKFRQGVSKPLLIFASASSTAFAYVAYHLYTTPLITVPVAAITLSSDSFLPRSGTSELVIGGGWELYAAAAGALAAVVPWQLFGVRQVEKRIDAAGESVEAATDKELEIQVTDEETVREDAKRWERGQVVSGGLAAVGALVGAYAAAWC